MNVEVIKMIIHIKHYKVLGSQLTIICIMEQLMLFMVLKVLLQELLNLLIELKIILDMYH